MSRLLLLLLSIIYCVLIAYSSAAADDDGSDLPDEFVAPGYEDAAKDAEKVATDDDDDDDYEEPDMEKDVYVLTDDNLDEFVQHNKFVIVEFYAPWCGACKSFAPEYDIVATRLKDASPRIYVAKVDATAQTALANRFEIKSYPTLHYFIDGQSYEYDGAREKDAMVQYMKEKTSPDYKPPAEAVITLTSDNFHDIVDAEDVMLVEFYAPWCGHCKSLAPKYEKAAKTLLKNDPPIKLGKVDATVASDLAKDYGVSGYPTLKVFRKGVATEYKGGREEQGIVDYMVGQVGDGSNPVDSVADIKKKLLEDDVTVVAFHSSEDDEKYKAYIEASNLLRESHTLFHTFSTDVLKHYGVEAGTVLVINAERYHTKHEPKSHKLVQTFDIIKYDHPIYVEQTVALKHSEAVDIIKCDRIMHVESKSIDTMKHYGVEAGTVLVINAERYHTKHEPKSHKLVQTDSTTAKEIETFVMDHSVPLVGTYTDPTKRYNNFPLCLVFYTVDWSFDHRKATQLWRRKIAAIAKDYRDITFAIIDDETHQEKLKEFGLDDSGEEINIGIYDKEGHKFPMDPMEEFDSDDIRSFLDDFKAGKLKRRLKSQPIPKKQDGPLITIVGNSFKDLVENTKKDVLLMLHAPWCGHCKKLMPVFKKLATKLQSHKNLVIARIDATANDVPTAYKVDGYPTIYFIKSNAKDSPVKYDGDRKMDSLRQFVEGHETKATKDEL